MIEIESDPFVSGSMMIKSGRPSVRAVRVSEAEVAATTSYSHPWWNLAKQSFSRGSCARSLSRMSTRFDATAPPFLNANIPVAYPVPDPASVRGPVSRALRGGGGNVGGQFLACQRERIVQVALAPFQLSMSLAC